MRSRRRKSEDHENHERWVVSYADFITLLFAFFVVLYATSQKDVKKGKELEKSIRRYLVKISMAVGGGGKKVGQNQDKQYESPIKSPIDTFPTEKKETREVRNLVETLVVSQLSDKELVAKVNDLYTDAMGVRLSLSSGDLFEQNSSRLKKSSLATLNKVGSFLKTIDHRIIIEGHTDNQPLNQKNYPSHWELASARATTLVRYFVKVHKIAPSRLGALSYGDTRPILPNTTAHNRAKNNRMDVLVVTEDTPL